MQSRRDVSVSISNNSPNDATRAAGVQCPARKEIANIPAVIAVNQGILRQKIDKCDSATEKQTKDGPQEPFKFAGYLAVMLASFFASSCMLCVKLLPVENSIEEKAKACMIRGFTMMMFCCLSLAHKRQSYAIPKGEYSVIIFRALLGALNTFLVFVAVQYITMGETSAIKYSSPVWTCMLSFIILHERVPITLLMGLPLSCVGIILLAYPGVLIDTSGPSMAPEVVAGELPVASVLAEASSSIVVNITRIGADFLVEEPSEDLPIEEYFSQRWLGILAALGSSLCISTSIIVLKFRKKTPIATCSFYMGLATAVVGFGIQLGTGFGAMPVTFLEWFLHFCIGFSAFACQCILQWALQYVPAGSYSVVRSLDIVLGFVSGAIFLHDIVLWTSIVGSVLIMVVVSMLMLNEYIEKLLRRLYCCARRRDSNTKLQLSSQK